MCPSADSCVGGTAQYFSDSDCTVFTHSQNLPSTTCTIFGQQSYRYACTTSSQPLVVTEAAIQMCVSLSKIFFYLFSSLTLTLTNSVFFCNVGLIPAISVPEQSLILPIQSHGAQCKATALMELFSAMAVSSFVHFSCLGHQMLK